LPYSSAERLSTAARACNRRLARRVQARVKASCLVAVVSLAAGVAACGTQAGGPPIVATCEAIPARTVTASLVGSATASRRTDPVGYQADGQGGLIVEVVPVQQLVKHDLVKKGRQADADQDARPQRALFSLPAAPSAGRSM
jgi:hypothetical protein